MPSNYDVIIIGSGPAGLTSAIYTARESLKTAVIAGLQYGGQLMLTTVVENFPGFPNGVKGPQLMQAMIEQAKNAGAEFITENATEINLSKRPFKITTYSKKVLSSKSLILTPGSTSKRLGIPGENKFFGRGVATCAVCDAPLYKNKTVAVVGGGDVAMEDATALAKFAKKVYLIHRRDQFRASKSMQERVFKTKKIKVLWNTEVKEIIGDDKVSGLTIQTRQNQSQKDSTLEIDGLFLAIGRTPNTEFIKKQLDLDQQGYIKTTNEVLTSKPGVFAAGEVADKVYRQAIVSAGMGCKAALEAIKWLSKQTE